MNHVIKSAVGWKPQKMPDFIEILYTEVIYQEKLIRMALHGTGEFELAQNYQFLKFSDIAWRSKTEEEREKIFKKFLKYKKKKSGIVQSTDGKLEIPCPKSIATKPGQKRRARSNKTHTVPKKTRVD